MRHTKVIKNSTSLLTHAAYFKDTGLASFSTVLLDETATLVPFFSLGYHDLIVIFKVYALTNRTLEGFVILLYQILSFVL